MSQSPSATVSATQASALAARAVAAIGLCGVALIHLLDITSKFDETPYMGWMYVGLIVSCLALAGALIRSGGTRTWAATVALPAAAVAGFVLSRTTGLPQATGDIGNWTEPLGMASLFVEGALIALGSGVLAARLTEQPRVAGPARRRDGAIGGEVVTGP
ncbi:MAG: hypothetical protein QOE06_161 [Thermoleophilaceae bacterium]|nr:hypothetical protein [Thermoleophilaceae bacterium]